MTKYCRLFLLAAAMALSVAVQAASYNGKWRITFEHPSMADLDGTVVIDGEAGSWVIGAKNDKNPCAGREAPIVVTKLTDDELVFDVLRSKGMESCKDWTVALTRDGEALKGEFAGGRKLTLERRAFKEPPAKPGIKMMPLIVK